MMVVGELLKDLPPEDRVSPIVGMLVGVIEKLASYVLRWPTPMKAKSYSNFAVS